MDERQQAEQLIQDLDQHRIDRRELMRRASSLGISATAISAALTRFESAAAQASGTPPVTERTTTMPHQPELAQDGASTLTRLSDDLAAAVERAGAGVVTINGRRRMPASGIVWTEDGLIITANHVVERDDDLTIGLPDGREVAATLIGRDPGTDLALLKVEASDLTVAPRAEAPTRIGHFVLAVGRPGPSGPMASFGVVSVVGGAWRTGRGGSVDGFIRADVAMLPGFSGGPLVDARGNVVGLNSSTLGRGGGLTVPVAAIEAVVTSLHAHGKVRHGFLGLGAQAVRLPAALIEAHALGRDQGLLVVAVEPDGPAERDGVMIGDIIIALDGDPVIEVEELQDKLRGDRVGQPLPVRVIRAGVPHELRVTVGERS